MLASFQHQSDLMGDCLSFKKRLAHGQAPGADKFEQGEIIQAQTTNQINGHWAQQTYDILESID